MSEENRELRIEDIRKICGFKSKSTIYNWIRSGKLKSRKIGSAGTGKGGKNIHIVMENDLKKFLTDYYPGTTLAKAYEIPYKFNRVPVAEDCWPLNLIREALTRLGGGDREFEESEIWHVNVPDFQRIISQLSDRQQKFLSLRYQHGMTLDEIGKYNGITRERARMIIAQAVAILGRRMRKEGCFNVLERDYEFLQKSLDKMTAWYELHKEEIYALGLKQRPEESDSDPDLTIPDIDLSQIPIMEIDLSIRAYNTLRRAHIDTLADILAFDQNQGENQLEKFTYKYWIQINHMGKKTLTEIATRVYDYCGYRLHWSGKPDSELIELSMEGIGNERKETTTVC